MGYILQSAKAINTASLTFVAVELLLFGFQVLVLFIVAFFISDMLASEQRLLDFINSKITASSTTEFFLTLGAVTFCLGLVTIAREFMPGGFVERVTEELLHELPRTFYFFGSSMTAVSLTAAIHLSLHPSATSSLSGRFLFFSILFAITFFAYGCGVKALLMRSRNSRGVQVQVAGGDA